MKTLLNRSRIFLIILVLPFALISGCASLPTDFEKEPSYALRDTGQTTLASRVRPLTEPHPELSGIYLMPKGIEALGARLRLSRLAETGIDLQYFLIEDDIVGDLLIRELMNAADRGVRVRILMDDIGTKGYELAFGVLTANPNIEIRLTNPFAHRDVRVAEVTDFQRINHRMHNKSITFDNAVSIVGGRNMGAPYFGAGDEFNYYDLDAFVIGHAVDEVSTEFDTYWNAAQSYPVSAFVDPDDSSESARILAERFRAAAENAETTPYVKALDSEIVDFVLGSDSDVLVWSQAHISYDLPYGEVTADGVEGEDVLGRIMIDALAESSEEFVLVSPYFVPGDAGLELFRSLQQRGAHTVVLTNSLASTDQVAAYSGYKEYRKSLLEIGVELWELMAFPAKSGDQPGALTEKRALHAKIYVIDRDRLFVGSFNFDPRSFNINSEMGIAIESDELAAQTSEGIRSSLPGIAWKLRLNAEGDIEWLDLSGEEEVVHDKAPQTTDWLRAKATMMGMDALEGQL